LTITFRPTTDDDLPLLHRWLNEPGVVEWWEGDDVSWEGVVRDYGSGRDDGTEHFLALLDGRPVGWIQTWSPEDDAGSVGIDYLLGEPADRGRGIGSAMIRAFVETVLPERTRITADPERANLASVGALRRAGFVPEGDLMVLDRRAAPPR
jgi:RimJ/RimL family protein N-acetyltransferase